MLRSNAPRERQALLGLKPRFEQLPRPMSGERLAARAEPSRGANSAEPICRLIVADVNEHNGDERKDALVPKSVGALRTAEPQVVVEPGAGLEIGAGLAPKGSYRPRAAGARSSDSDAGVRHGR